MNKISGGILLIASEDQGKYLAAELESTGLSDNIQCEFEMQAIETAMQAVEKWEIILCSLVFLNSKWFKSLLANCTPNMHASVVALQPGSEPLGLENVYHLGVEDIVDITNIARIAVVAQRESINAQLRRKLSKVKANQEQARPDIEPLDPGENVLLQQILSKKFVLHFQPILDIGKENSDVNKFEVFVRLQKSTGELVYPDELFGLARKKRLVPLVDEWVVKQSLDKIKQLNEEAQHITLFLNIAEETIASPISLATIQGLIERASLPPGSIVIELGKTSFSKHEQAVRELESTLNKNGHGILFGASDLADCEYMKPYSSLVSYLRLNPSLVTGIVMDTEKRNRLTNLIACASSSGVRVIASHIENPDVLPVLYSVGVSQIQGYFVGEPGDEPVVGKTDEVDINDEPRFIA